ncbi:MAG: DNA-directed RNA polymerase subunit alpha [Rickettsiaceae bacterium]
MLSVLNKNWNSLIKPSRFDYKAVADNAVTLVVEPLTRGFGLTLGNALRRVLLSSIVGASVTSIKIDGVMHEFAHVPGVNEDIADVILNIKSVIFKNYSNEKKVLALNASGPCSVTADMITTDQDVEILNPSQVICTLSNSSKLKMQLTLEVDSGFKKASNKSDDDVDTIPIDAAFSPIKNVIYTVENTRVGQVTDYDKLSLTVKTDGTVAPDTAIAIAARILQDQLHSFITFEDKEETQKQTVEKLKFNPLLLQQVSNMELSVRALNCLRSENIVYIGDLVTKAESEMLKVKNFGRKSLNEIKALLIQQGLSFNMDVPSWPPDNLDELSKTHEDQF